MGQFVKGMMDLIDSKLASCSFQTHTNGESSVSQQSRASSVSFRSQDALVASDQNKSCKRKRKDHEEGDDDNKQEDSQRKRRGSSLKQMGRMVGNSLATSSSTNRENIPK